MREKNNEQLLLCAGNGICCSVFVEGSRLEVLVHSALVTAAELLGVLQDG